MPNWCSNNATVSHSDPAMMQAFADGVKNGELFEKLLPLATKDGEWDYFTAIDQWGVKWDVRDGDFTLDETGLSGDGFFNTAWGPPITAYDRLTEMGFQISATYIETGMCFAGAYDSEAGDDCFEYDFDDPDWRDEITNDEVLGMLEDEYESWKEWQEENEEDA